MKVSAPAIARRVALAVMVAVMINAGAAWADCYSEQDRIMARLQNMMNEMNSGATGFCDMARTIKREYPSMLNFYNRCPVADPDGSMRGYIRQMLAWADEVEDSACTN